MTPAETIQAAIDKLSDQRDASRRLVPGRWSNAEDGQEVTGSHGAVAESRSEVHCDLIVTLHATIEAQLSILQEGHQVCVNLDEIGFTGNPGRARPAFNLARAILGEQVDA
jgi:hypothetical protein